QNECSVPSVGPTMIASHQAQAPSYLATCVALSTVYALLNALVSLAEDRSLMMKLRIPVCVSGRSHDQWQMAATSQIAAGGSYERVGLRCSESSRDVRTCARSYCGDD